MKFHSNYEEVKDLVSANINVLLEGETGSGKTTLLRQLATDLALDFYTVPMTKQTTLNALIGFISINGTYIPTQLRKAVEEGGMLLLDEIDAGDPNVLLALNTLENGYLAFPDGIVDVHEDFRLVATSNPQGEHSVYTGRSKLDAATRSRFDPIAMPRDEELEIALTDTEAHKKITVVRELLAGNGITKIVSMRDTIRLHKRSAIGREEKFIQALLGDTDDMYLTYKDTIVGIKDQSEAQTVDELWGIINKGK